MTKKQDWYLFITPPHEELFQTLEESIRIVWKVSNTFQGLETQPYSVGDGLKTMRKPVWLRLVSGLVFMRAAGR